MSSHFLRWTKWSIWWQVFVEFQFGQSANLCFLQIFYIIKFQPFFFVISWFFTAKGVFNGGSPIRKIPDLATLPLARLCSRIWNLRSLGAHRLEGDFSSLGNCTVELQREATLRVKPSICWSVDFLKNPRGRRFYEDSVWMLIYTPCFWILGSMKNVAMHQFSREPEHTGRRKCQHFCVMNILGLHCCQLGIRSSFFLLVCATYVWWAMRQNNWKQVFDSGLRRLSDQTHFPRKCKSPIIHHESPSSTIKVMSIAISAFSTSSKFGRFWT